MKKEIIRKFLVSISIHFDKPAFIDKCTITKILEHPKNFIARLPADFEEPAR
jgi:hypothetical protein